MDIVGLDVAFLECGATRLQMVIKPIITMHAAQIRIVQDAGAVMVHALIPTSSTQNQSTIDSNQFK